MTQIDLPGELWQNVGKKLDAMSLVNLEIALPRERQGLREWAWGPGTSEYVPPHAIPLNDSLAWRAAVIQTWPLLKAPKSSYPAQGEFDARRHCDAGCHEAAIRAAQPVVRWPYLSEKGLSILMDALTAQGRVYEANLLGVRVTTLQIQLTAAVSGGDAAVVAALLAAGAHGTLTDLCRACSDGNAACVEALARDVAHQRGWGAEGLYVRNYLGQALLEGDSPASALALMRTGMPALDSSMWDRRRVCPMPFLQGLKEQASTAEGQQVARMMNFSDMVTIKLRPYVGERLVDAAYCHLLAQVGGLSSLASFYIAAYCLGDANWHAGQACLQTLVRSGFKLGPASLRIIKTCEYERFALLPRLQDMVKLAFNVNDYINDFSYGCDSVLHVIARCHAPDAQDCITYVCNQGARLRRLRRRGWPGQDISLTGRGWPSDRLLNGAQAEQEKRSRRQLLKPRFVDLIRNMMPSL